MSKELFEIIFKAVVMVICGLVTYYIKPYIKSKVYADKLAELERYAEIAVRCAEQIYSDDQFENKKKYALEYLAEKVGDLGVNMSIVDIEALIESTVNYVKYGTEYNR